VGIDFLQLEAFYGCGIVHQVRKRPIVGATIVLILLGSDLRSFWLLCFGSWSW
jgi:hypothetical protein